MSELKEWCVDWQVEAVVTLEKLVTVSRTEIIEAATAEEAVQKVQDELDLGEEDLDRQQFAPEDFQIEEPNLESFKVNGEVTAWQP